MGDPQILKLISSIEYHKPNEEQTNRIEEMREAAIDLARAIGELLPASSRERSLAITSLEETVMWAVKGIVLEVV